MGYGFCTGVHHFDVQKFHHLPDSQARWCGVDTAVADKPYLAYCYRKSGEDMTRGRECIADCSETTRLPDGCIAHESTLFHHLACLPDNTTRFDPSSSFVGGARVGKALTHVTTLALSSLLSFLAALLYLWVIMQFTAIVFRCSIMLAIVVPIPIGLILIYVPTALKEKILLTNSDPLLDLIGGYCCFAFSLSMLCVYCCNLRSVRMAIICLEAAVDCINEIPTLLVWAVFLTLVRFGVFFFWLVGFMKILLQVESQAHWMDGFSNYNVFAFYFYIWMGLWLLAFSVGVGKFAVNFATQQWFFEQSFAFDYDGISKSEAELKRGPFRAAWIALRYHSGTMAAAGAMVTLMWLPGLILSIIVGIVDKVPWPWVDEVKQCFKCCIFTYVNFLQRFSWDALLATAANGNDFKDGAAFALTKLQHRPVADSLLNSASWMLIMAGVGGIAVMTSLLADILIWLQHSLPAVSASLLDKVTDSTMVSYVAVLLAMIVTYPCISLFNQVSDALLFSFALDETRSGSHFSPSRAVRRIGNCYTRAKEHVENTLTGNVAVLFNTVRALEQITEGASGSDSPTSPLSGV